MKQIIDQRNSNLYVTNVCFAPDEIFAVTDINKTGNMCITLRRVRVTVFAVEKQ